MASTDSAGRTVELSDHYVIRPRFDFAASKDWKPERDPCRDGFRYASDTTDGWRSLEDLTTVVAALDIPEAREFARERGLSA